MIVCDDKKGLKAINRTFGALLAHTLRGLDSNSELTTSTFPDLEIGLERLTRWGVFAEKRLQLDSPYLCVVKGYGVKLFGDRTQEEREKSQRLRLKAYKQFLKKLPKFEKENRRLPNGNYVMDEGDGDQEGEGDEDGDEEDDKNPWKGAKSTDVEFDLTQFDVESAFKKYNK